MVKYIQCKNCHDEDVVCYHCNGSGRKKNFKTKFREILYCVFPCLNNDKKFGYKAVPTESHFYNDLFSMMNNMESTSLMSERDDTSEQKPETELDSDDFDSDNEEITPDSSFLFEKKEENITVKKIDIPKNGFNQDFNQKN